MPAQTSMSRTCLGELDKRRRQVSSLKDRVREFRQVEEILREREERLKILFDYAPDDSSLTGMDDCVAKPIQPEEVFSAIDRVGTMKANLARSVSPGASEGAE